MMKQHNAKAAALFLKEFHSPQNRGKTLREFLAEKAAEAKITIKEIKP